MQERLLGPRMEQIPERKQSMVRRAMGSVSRKKSVAE